MSGTPYLAGSGSAASGGSAILTVDLDTDVSSLDTILVGVLVSYAAVTVSVADTAGNTYSQTLSDTTETAAQLYVFESDGSSPLTAGVDTVIVTYSATTSVQGAIVVGDNNVIGADKTVIAHGSSTSPSSGSSGTLSQAEEHVIGFICNAAGGGVPSSWTGTTNVLGNVEGGTTTRLTAAYVDVTATTAKTAAATITSAVWSAAIVTTEVAPVTVLTTMSDGVENEAYSQTLEASGGVGTYTWTISSGSLPTGLSLSAGVISGTPTVSGTFTFTTEATDSYSVAGTLVQTITFMASGASVAPALSLPNNLLSAADSDFEVSGFTWAANTNAGSLSRGDETSLTGSECLKWTATADGDTRISTGYYTVKPNLPYIASGFILPCGQRDTDIGIAWYTSGNELIRTDIGSDDPSSTIQWQPVAGNFTSPDNAAKCKIVVEVQEANKGDVNHIDLMYFTQTNAQVLIDWNNPTFDPGGEAGQDFMDVSMFVRMDSSNGINLTSGRQDSISDVQPGSGTFILQNDTGIFSKSKSTALVTAMDGDVTLQRRCQVNLADENGVWYTRADGPIAEIDYSFDNPGLTSQVMVSITDVLAYLNREDSMTCWTKENVLNDGPAYHWSLDDAGNAGGAGVAAETSGNNGPPMRLLNSDKTGVATISFQDTTGGVETLADTVKAGQPDGSEYWTPGSNQPSSATRGLDAGVQGPYTSPIGSVYLTPVLTAQGGANYFGGNTGYQFQVTLPEMTPNATGTDFSYEVWFTMDPLVGTDVADDYGPYTILALGSSNRTGFNINCGIYLATNHLVFLVESRIQPPAFIGRNFSGSAPLDNLAQVSLELETDAIQLPHHLILTVQGDPSAPVVSGWFDGRAFGDSTDDTGTGITIPAGTSFDTLCIGGSFGGRGAHFGGVSLASVYDYYIPGSQAINHANMGQYGMWEATTDDCIAQLATFAGIPSFWSNVTNAHSGLTMTEYQDITGSNPLSNMQLYEQAESGLLFVDRTGALNFHTRDWRMGYGAPDLLLPPDSFDGGMGYELIDQFMQNESAVATQTYQTGAAYINAESQDEYGTYATNPVDSPLQLPLITLNRGFGQLGLASFNYFADPNLTDVAAWNANIYADPFLMPGELTVDLLTLDPSTGLGISDFYALEIDNMIAPTGTLPESFPDSQAPVEWFIEGINETITQSSRVIQFYCSPAQTQRAWKPGDSTYGVLGATARIGISTADLSTPQADGKDVSHDAGRPYWPPTFSSTMNSPSAGEEFVVVQNQNAGYLGADSTFTIDLDSATTEGNTLIAILVPVEQQVSQVELGVVDTFSTAVTNWNVDNTNEAIYIMYDPDCSGGQTQVNITLDGSAECFGAVLEVEGILAASPLDQTASSVSNSQLTTFSSGATAETTSPNEFLVGGVVGSSENAAIVVSADWTSQAIYSNWASYGYKAVTTEDTYEFSGTGNDYFGVAMATFVAAAGATNAHNFVGALDIRGLTDNLSLMLNPPMCVVSANTGLTQTVASGPVTTPQIFWDTVHVDTVGGMGLVPGWPNWYVCLVPGFYDIDGSIDWAGGTGGGATACQGWIIVAQAAAQAVAAGVGGSDTPTTVGAYVCPLGEQVFVNVHSIDPVTSPTTRLYLGIGDMVTLGGEQSTGSNRATSTTIGGSHMSLLYRGMSQSDDRVQINNALSFSGSGSAPVNPSPVTYYTKTYTNTHTYSYYGAAIGYNRKNTDGSAYQGTYSGGSGVTGSEVSQIVFNHAQIASDLSGKTITSVTLQCHNQHFWYDSGGKLMLGWSSTTPGGSTFHANHSGDHTNLFTEGFNVGQTKTFTIPTSFASAFKNSSAKALLIGNDSTTNLAYYGFWQGGPGHWTLTIKYHS